MNVIVRKEEIKKEKVVKSLIEVLRYRKYSFENKVKLNAAVDDAADVFTAVKPFIECQIQLQLHN